MFQSHNLEDFFTAYPDYTPTGMEQAVYLSADTALVVHSSTHCKSDIYFSYHTRGTAGELGYFSKLIPMLDRDWFIGVKRAKSVGRKPYTEFVYDSTEGFPNHLNLKYITGLSTLDSIKISQAFQHSALSYAKSQYA